MSAVKRIKIEPHEAAEWMKQGYDIECYVLVQPVAAAKKLPPGRKRASPTHVTPEIPQSAQLAFSVETKYQPKRGELGRVWPKLMLELWDKDITKTYSRNRIEQVMGELGHPNPRNAVAYLVNRVKKLRVVEKK